MELPEAADFRETTSLTVEELSDGIRCFTVRPLHSQRWGLQLLAGSLLFAALSASLPPPLIVVAVLFALGATARAAFSVRLESLLVMEGIGLQLTTRFTTGREKVVFVETSAVSEMFISEAVRLDCCFFYMACLLHGDDLCHQPSLVVPFRELQPSLRQLRRIYRGTRAVLMGEEEGTWQEGSRHGEDT